MMQFGIFVESIGPLDKLEGVGYFGLGKIVPHSLQFTSGTNRFHKIPP